MKTGRDPDRHERGLGRLRHADACNLTFARLPAPIVDQRAGNTTTPGDLCDRAAAAECLVEDRHFLLGRPPPPSLDPENLDPPAHRCP
jgi:hypothetical protein